jgi:hypothetical protein
MHRSEQTRGGRGGSGVWYDLVGSAAAGPAGAGRGQVTSICTHRGGASASTSARARVPQVLHARILVPIPQRSQPVISSTRVDISGTPHRGHGSSTGPGGACSAGSPSSTTGVSAMTGR